MARPSTRWTVIVGLVRWADSRCPSDVLALTWARVHFDERLLTIASPEGVRHGKGIRIVPIDRTIHPLLMVAFAEATEGAEFVAASPPCR
jgi:hypothetical protein